MEKLIVVWLYSRGAESYRIGDNSELLYRPEFLSFTDVLGQYHWYDGSDVASYHIVNKGEDEE